jgi:hypothetical protein
VHVWSDAIDWLGSKATEAASFYFISGDAQVNIAIMCTLDRREVAESGKKSRVSKCVIQMLLQYRNPLRSSNKVRRQNC